MQSKEDISTEVTSHEHLVQVLGTILLQLNSLQTIVRNETVPPDLNVLYNGLTTIEQMTREVIYEIRSASDDDLPLADLVGVTLVEALSRAIEETAESLGLSSRVAFSGEERPLPGYTERLFYRIAQEALYQIQLHNNARRLRFTFSYGRDEVQMSIEDNGTLPANEAETPLPHFKDEGRATVTVNEAEVPLPHFKEEWQSVDLLRSYSALRHRIEHLGGSLEVISHIEQGTRVQVRVPYTLSSVENQVIAPNLLPVNAYSTSKTPITTTISVLVVDGHAVSRAGLRHLLESYPDLHVIGEAADGVQAVSETLELGPQVVLMDAQLPNNQSMEALKQIKQLNLETRVLLLSAQEREEYLYETLRAGADGYVLKDIAPDELAHAVRAVARGEVLVQPQLAGRLLSRFGKQGRGNTPYETLTAREQEVLHLLARGMRNKEIAARLFVSERTVNFHLANIYQKLNVSGRTEALSKALEQGLITA
ncbi:MAG: LuxR C-terminal-related transcriptional regulator [Chloroflexota bacterium]|nr:LuxR C-terminal-related transcriptional regulator [Chloroflexota bacterium]